MERVFLRIQKYCIIAIKYLFFVFNLALLVGLSIKTVNLWLSDSFSFKDILASFPQEPEFLDKNSARNQFVTALSIESILFIIGGFICYELLIKKKNIRRSLIAPVSIIFLWAAGESIHLFLPATEKVHRIKTCQAMNISWDTKKHKCRLMDLELKRFEEIKRQKKTTAKARLAVAVKTAPTTDTKTKISIKKEKAGSVKKRKKKKIAGTKAKTTPVKKNTEEIKTPLPEKKETIQTQISAQPQTQPQSINLMPSPEKKKINPEPIQPIITQNP